MERIALSACAARVVGRLRGAGHLAYAVGGCVRDALLGRAASDWDVCTDATPERVTAIFGEANCLPTGVRHGTVTVKSEGGFVEVTTFRTDGAYTDGRHPDDVRFVRDVRLDLARRDFTVNAMAYSDEEGLIDPFGGLADLRAGVLRAVGDPAARFSEDALRILRLFRFGAQLGFALDGPTRDAALALAPTLARVSAERIRAELVKLLCGERPGAFLPEALLRAALPEALCGGEAACALRLAALDAVNARSPDAAALRLAALLCGAGERGARDALARLRFSRAETERVARLVAESGLQPAAGPDALRVQARRCLGRMAPEDLSRAARLRAAFLAAGGGGESLSPLLAAAEAAVAAGDCCRVAQLAVSGDDLAALGLSGPAVGRALSALLEGVVTGALENERGALLAAARERASRGN